ncbi:MAG: S9 family peptidase [Anaerolineae bacterium]|nr:S9 family peptidase [Anaerolineae bacterium]
MTKPEPTFSIEELAVFPLPGMGLPANFVFSRDDSRLMYLYGDGGPLQQLYALDTKTGEVRVLVAPPGGGVNEKALSPEEELRRQRERMLTVGITHYYRAQLSDRLLLPIAGNVYVYDDEGGLRQVVDCAGKPPALNPALSPDGEWVAYVQDAEVYVVSATGGDARQVTSGARGTGKTNGLAEYIAQEELGRSDGFWWSPDGRLIAYAEVDETHIPAYRIMHQGKDTTGDSAQEDHRYPFAGEANAIVRLAVVPREGGAPVWMNMEYGEEVYLVRAFWWADGQLGAQILSRDQSWLDLVRFDPATGQRTSVLREQNPYWVSPRTQHFMLLKNGGFLWGSERSGFNHVYLYAPDGELVRQITEGEWVVDEIAAVDEANQTVYISGNREHPTQRHLYAVSMDGEDIRRITTESGTHATTPDNHRQRFVDVSSAADRTPTVTVRSLTDDAVVHAVPMATDSRLADFQLEPPELVSLPNRDGVTLHGAIFRPPQHFGPGPYPVVVHVYGGPGPQMVADQWLLTANLQLQYLRQQGFLVFRLDNRGSARRGLAFEGAIKHHMGTVEVDDQVDGVRWLVEQGLADPARVGVFGWSYGGYMTLMCLAKAPDVFKVGVAGAPVASWDGYDTGYTERYMGTPQSNPDGYAEGSVMNYVGQIRGKLLLIHGMIDENVHFRHTARLINALNRARKIYDLLLFPDERHMPRLPTDKVYLNERIVGYFQQHL